MLIGAYIEIHLLPPMHPKLFNVTPVYGTEKWSGSQTILALQFRPAYISG